MGYDMRWVRKADGEEEAHEAARVEFYAASERRGAIPKEERGEWTKEEMASAVAFENGRAPANASDRYRAAHAEVDRAYQAMDRADRSYFRLNIFGMGRYCQVMADLGVLREDYDRAEQSAYPEDVPDEYWDWDDDEPTDIEPETLARFTEIKAAIGAWQSWSPAGPVKGIPAHKFGSNDGWHVTPEEAFYAASTIRALDPQVVTKTLTAHGFTAPDRLAYWESWVQWLDDSSQHGGFKVH
jgi:hypothetical protein